MNNCRVVHLIITLKIFFNFVHTKIHTKIHTKQRMEDLGRSSLDYEKQIIEFKF
jgi:hypothetical protein